MDRTNDWSHIPLIYAVQGTYFAHSGLDLKKDLFEDLRNQKDQLI